MCARVGPAFCFERGRLLVVPPSPLPSIFRHAVDVHFMVYPLPSPCPGAMHFLTPLMFISRGVKFWYLVARRWWSDSYCCVNTVRAGPWHTNRVYLVYWRLLWHSSSPIAVCVPSPLSSLCGGLLCNVSQVCVGLFDSLVVRKAQVSRACMTRSSIMCVYIHVMDG